MSPTRDLKALCHTLAPYWPQAWYRLARTWLTLVAGFLLPAHLPAQNLQLTGTVEVSIAEDFVRPAQLGYSLRAQDGRHYPLRLTQAQVNNLGGTTAIAGRTVAVVGSVVRAWRNSGLAGAPIESEELAVSQVSPLGGPSLSPSTAALLPAAQNYVVVGCKFPGISAEPTSPQFWSSMMSGTRPGLNHYFQEVSSGAFTVSGSQATQWVTMPQARSYYNNSSGGINQHLLAQHCLTAADPVVSFIGFAGVILQFNENLGNISWAWLAPVVWSVDGQAHALRTVVLASWAATHQNVWVHEMYHTFGLWHSSGSTTNAYTSFWDVLSHGQYSSSVFGQNGNVGMHTIAGYKALLGWLPSSRIYDASSGTTQIALERSALPVSGTNYRLARISIPGTSEVYTVEARRFAGYDQPGAPQGMAGEGVIIHRMTIDGSRLPGASADIAALVMDGDGNSNVNDAGAIWLPGEVFTGAGGVSIRVDQTSGSSAYLVTLSTSSTYRLRVTASGTGGGRITSNPSGINCYYPGNNAALQGSCQFDYSPSTFVSLTQTPDPGTSFLQWSGDCANLSCAVDMSRDRNVSAAFATTCALTLGAGSGGSVALTSGTASGTCGRTVTVTATPNAGYTFQGWSNGATANPYALAVTSTQSLIASFAAQCAINLSANPSNGGTAAITSGTATGGCGRQVTATATAHAGWEFQGWTDNGVLQSANPSYTFVAHTNRSLVASFAAQCAVNLSATPADGGTAVVSTGSASGACGRTVTVTATPNAGYSFQGWSNGATANPHTLIVTSTQSLSASFVVQCTLTVTPSPGGTAVISGGVATGSCGRSITVTATPNAGYAFQGWSNGATSSPYTFILNSSQSLAATFVAQCTLTVNAGPGGTAAISSGTATGTCGRIVTLTATPGAGWSFTAWEENQTPVTPSNPYGFLLTTDRTVEASFQPANLAELASRTAEELLGSRRLSILEQGWLDRQGNRNGRVDLGDLLALLDHHQGLTLAPAVRAQGVDTSSSTPDSGPSKVKP